MLNCNSEKPTSPLYSFTETINGLYLALEMNVEDAVPTPDGFNQVDGNTFKGKVRITNVGSIAYDGDIEFKLAEFDLAKGKFYYIKTLSTKAAIGILDTKEIEFNYPDLTIGLYYALVVGYRDGESMVYMNLNADGTLSYNQFYLMTESSGLQSIELDQSDAEVYDIRGVRQGKASDIKSLPKGIYIINKKKVINN
jgi:hypothetical protein